MGNLAATTRKIYEALDASEPFNVERLFRLLYLVDWRATLKGHATITGIEWTAEGSLDLVGDVPDADEELVGFLQEADGGDVLVVLAETVVRANDEPLDQDEAEIVDFVIKQAGHRTLDELNRLVFATRPLMAGPRDRPLDLPKAAEEQLRSVGAGEATRV